jgi:hypothetical protein
MSTDPVDVAIDRARQGGREGRSVYIRLYLIARRNYDHALEHRLKVLLPEMPQDDQLILEMFLDELDRALALEAFQAPSSPADQQL